MTRSRRTGWRQHRATSAPRARRRVPPRAAWASQFQRGRCQVMSVALASVRTFTPAGLGDEPLELPELLGGGVARLEQGEDQLVHGAVEDLVQEAGGDLLAGVEGGVDEG